MTIYSRTVIVFVIALGFINGSSAFGNARSEEGALSDKLVTIECNQQPLHVALDRLMNVYDVPIGFVQSPKDYDHSDYRFGTEIRYVRSHEEARKDNGGVPYVTGHFISVNYRNARLETVLDDIVGQMQNYKWDIENDVVVIMPSDDLDPRIEELLGTKVASFQLPADAPIYDVRQTLVTLPDSLAWLNKNQLLFDPGTWVAFTRRKLPNEMNFSDLTFRELLNTITKVKRGGWQIGRINRLSYVDFQL
jgi:hypothetical protein